MVLDIFKEEQIYYDYLDSLCEMNCLNQLLAHYKIKDSFRYINVALKMHMKLDKEANKYSVLHREDLLIKDVSDYIEKHYYPAGYDAIKVLDENKKLLDQGIPVMVKVDMYHIPYSQYYHEKHNHHCIILCGYDETSVKIIDWYDWKYKGDIELETFLTARSSECELDDSPYSGYPIRNEWTIVKPFDTEVSTKGCLKLTLDKTLHEYYETKENSVNDIYGLNTLRVIEDDAKKRIDDSEERQKAMLNSLRRTSIAMTSDLTLFCTYLSHINEELAMESINEVINAIKEDISAWRNFGLVMIKSSALLSLKRYKTALEKLHAMIEVEEARYHKLVELKKQLA